MDVRVGLWRRLSTEELILLNCGVGEDSWESLGLQGDPTSPSKGDQSWVFIGRTDAEAETPIFWPPHAKSWLIGKDSDAGRDWGQEEKRKTEDKMAGWHHQLYAHDFGWTLGIGDGQRGLACCDSWGCKSRTQLSDWTEVMYVSVMYILYVCIKICIWYVGTHVCLYACLCTIRIHITSVYMCQNMYLLSNFFREELKILWLPYGWCII